MKKAIFLAGSLLAAACGGSTPQPAGDALPAGHPEIQSQSSGQPSAQSPRPAAFGGEVLETMDSGGSSYVRLAVADGEIWAAGPQSTLEIGQSIVLTGASLMSNFTSRSLGRTFEEIYFSGGFRLAGGSVIAGPPPRRATPPPADAATGKAIEVIHGGGYTYVHVQVGAETVWIAGEGVDVKEGEAVSWSNALPMGEFHSSTLDRTFEDILFVAKMWASPPPVGDPIG